MSDEQHDTQAEPEYGVEERLYDVHVLAHNTAGQVHDINIVVSNQQLLLQNLMNMVNSQNQAINALIENIVSLRHQFNDAENSRETYDHEFEELKQLYSVLAEEMRLTQELIVNMEFNIYPRSGNGNPQQFMSTRSTSTPPQR